MGRGNVCVFGKYEGLYYIDKDYLHVYRSTTAPDDCPETKTFKELGYEELIGGDWEFDEFVSGIVWAETKEHLQSRITERFKSFEVCDRWIGRGEEHAILENELFYIAVQDNEWSMAVKLIEKEDPWCYERDGLRKRHYQTYLDGIRDILFELFPTLGVYGGAWTSGTIRREDYEKEGATA